MIQYCSLGNFDFFEDAAFKFIYSFHMPLFMLISGYLFKFSLEKRKLSDLLVHKTQALLQPIIMGAVLSFLLVYAPKSVMTGNARSIFDGFSGNISGFWFLWSVLSCSVAVAIANKFTENRIFRCLLLMLGVFLVSLFPNGQMNLFMYPYFILGFWFARIPEGKWKTILKRIGYFSLIIFPVMLFYYKKEHYIYTSGLHCLHYNEWDSIKIDAFRWAIGLVGSICFIEIVSFLYAIYIRIPKIKFQFKFFSSMGKKSLQIYILQSIFLERWLPVAYKVIVSSIGSNFLISNIDIYNWLITPLLAFICGTVLLLLIRILESTKISQVIFGK